MLPGEEEQQIVPFGRRARGLGMEARPVLDAGVIYGLDGGEALVAEMLRSPEAGLAGAQLDVGEGAEVGGAVDGGGPLPSAFNEHQRLYVSHGHAQFVDVLGLVAG